jgi:hypothetical protein
MCTGFVILDSILLRNIYYSTKFFRLEINPEIDRATPSPALSPRKNPARKLHGLTSWVKLKTGPRIIPKAPKMDKKDPIASLFFEVILSPDLIL